MNKINLSKKLKDGEYYKYDKDLGFLVVDPKDIIYKTHTIESLEKYYKSYIELKNTLKKHNLHLSDSLKSYGFNIEDGDLELTIEKCKQLLDDLVVEIDELNTIEVGENGHVMNYNKNRYILSKEDLKVPEDLNNGYYKVSLKDGKIEFILDEYKYEEEMI